MATRYREYDSSQAKTRSKSPSLVTLFLRQLGHSLCVSANVDVHAEEVSAVSSAGSFATAYAAECTQ